VARLIYAALTSLDGYIADRNGRFDWAEPSEEVHRFVNDLERSVGTHLYGRRMYEVLVAWETMESQPDLADYVVDFARIWRAARKIVYSRTLTSVSSERTEIVPEFDVEAVRAMKATEEQDILVGGADLAAQAIRAGLVDDFHLFLSPIVVGGGKRALPGEAWVELRLRDHRRFANGVLYAGYSRQPG
jgi:dihydrofolate reductase